ncbi:MAG: glucose-1-phosphate adenylyltransferase [Fuerstiella sp.]|nr:glucose-1-phosphate adenylyltransferase [Fuerstiella sp.]
MRHTIGIILGGGKGTRLLPLTEKRSKPAVPIGGKYRLIDVPISNCLHSQLNRIYVLTQFNSVSLHRHIRQTYSFDVFSDGFVEVLPAQQTLDLESWYQGTADAVRKQLRFLKEPGIRYVLILSGDQLYRMDYNQMLNSHLKAGAAVTISTVPVDRDAAQGFGIMQLNDAGRVTGFVEKPQSQVALSAVRTPAEWIDGQGIESREREYLASMGIYLFDRDVLVDLLETTSHDDFGRDIFPLAIRNHHVQTHLFDDFWADIGTIKSFYEANLMLAQPHPPFTLAHRRWPIFTHPRFLPSSRFDGCHISSSLVSDGCFIGPDARILNSVVGLRCQVAERVKMRDTVIMGADYYEPGPDSEAPSPGIGAGAEIEGALIDKNVVVGTEARIVASEAPSANGDYGDVFMRDGIAVIRRGAVIPPRWSFALT